MSKSANPGGLRTAVRFFRTERVPDAEGVSSETEVNVFGAGQSVRCKWVNAHGTDVFEAMTMEISEPATLTCRYSPKITADLTVRKAGDDKPYEIISVDNVEERDRWLEIKVKRKEAAR